MSHKSCNQEGAIAGAVRSGEWNEGLEAHLRTCAACRSVQEAVRWMQALASEAQPSAIPESDLPDAQVLWLRAQLFERQAAAENAQRVLQWVEVAWVTAVCVGLGFWLAWNWNEIGGEIANWLGWGLFDAWPTLWTKLSSYSPTNASTLFFSALAVISLLALAVAYPLRARA